MKTLPFLEHFVATKRRVADLSLEKDLCGVAADLPGYVYAERFWIEIEPDGQLYMPVAQEACGAQPDDIAVLEGLLFEFATRDCGLDAEECHLSIFARGGTCPKVCPLCHGDARGIVS
jgi:hypothetical protein